MLHTVVQDQDAMEIGSGFMVIAILDKESFMRL